MGSISGWFKTRGRAGLLDNFSAVQNELGLGRVKVSPTIQNQGCAVLLKGKCNCLCEDELGKMKVQFIDWCVFGAAGNP